MQNAKKWIKKSAILALSACTLSFVSLTPVHAESLMEKYLADIRDYTFKILGKVNELPVALNNLSMMALSWTTPDETDSTAAMQENFTLLGTSINDDLKNQKLLQPTLQKELLGSASKATMPNANDLVYGSLLGMPFFPEDPRGKPPTVNPAYNYFKNIATLNFPHTAPGPWGGNPDDQVKYMNYYNSIMAIESYNSFLLSRMYTDYNNGSMFSKQQTALIQQATSGEWLAQIASQSLGVLLRQILMYQSQTYVLMSQMLETQRQAVTAQAITNSLLILSNQSTEQLLITRAKTPSIQR